MHRRRAHLTPLCDMCHHKSKNRIESKKHSPTTISNFKTAQFFWSMVSRLFKTIPVNIGFAWSILCNWQQFYNRSYKSYWWKVDTNNVDLWAYVFPIRGRYILCKILSGGKKGNWRFWGKSEKKEGNCITNGVKGLRGICYAKYYGGGECTA